MIIRVEVKNALIGDSIFWEGDSEDIDQIRNIPAQSMAVATIIDGKPRKLGMWRVSEVEEEHGN